MESTTQSIGRIIAEQRRAAGWTQTQLAEKLGISGQAVSKWENGESMPDILLLPQLGQLFGISVDVLLGGEESERDEQRLIHDYCTYAAKKGRSAAVLEILSRMFYPVGKKIGGRGVDQAAGHLRISCPDWGFAAAGSEWRKTVYRQEPAQVAAVLTLLAEPNVQAVLRCTSLNCAQTVPEIAEAAALSTTEAQLLLLRLMEQNLLCYDADGSGKQGYLHSAGIVGAELIYLGCSFVGSGKEFDNWIWYTTNDPHD